MIFKEKGIADPQKSRYKNAKTSDEASKSKKYNKETPKSL